MWNRHDRNYRNPVFNELSALGTGMLYVKIKLFSFCATFTTTHNFHSLLHLIKVQFGLRGKTRTYDF